MMKPVAKKATPAAIAVLRQATAIAPSRMKASDGLLPSKAHIRQNPNSDHNSGFAVDLTHDPKHSIDCAVIFKELQKDPRVKYLIFNHRIWSPQQGVDIYTGSNPHTKHIHISINDKCGNDTSPWFAWLNKPKYTTADQARLAANKLKPLPKKKVKR
jgi:hypothetical protein